MTSRTDKEALIALADDWFDRAAKSAREAATNTFWPTLTCRERAQDIAAMFQVAAALRTQATTRGDKEDE
jgi:hypothetical protein